MAFTWKWARARGVKENFTFFHWCSVAEVCRSLQIGSYLTLLSILGTLIRIGLSDLWENEFTTWKGGNVVWANLTGCFIMGYLMQNSRASRSRSLESNAEEKVEQVDATCVESKKISSPFRIGLTSGLCACLTSFSGMMWEIFRISLGKAYPVKPPFTNPKDLTTHPSAAQRLSSTIATVIIHLCVPWYALQLGFNLAKCNNFNWVKRLRIKFIWLLRFFTFASASTTTNTIAPASILSPSRPCHNMLVDNSGVHEFSRTTAFQSLAGKTHRVYLTIFWTILALLGWLALLTVSIVNTLSPISSSSALNTLLPSLAWSPLACFLRYTLSCKLNALCQITRFDSRSSKSPTFFPLGTLTANLLACLVLSIAWFFRCSKHSGESPPALPTPVNSIILPSIVTGFCGSLSTVSAWFAELTSLPTFSSSFIYLVISLLLAYATICIVQAPLLQNSTTS